MQKFLNPISKACEVTRKKQKLKIEKGIKNRNSLDSRHDTNMSKTVQELERKYQHVTTQLNIAEDNAEQSQLSITRIVDEMRDSERSYKMLIEDYKAIAQQHHGPYLLPHGVQSCHPYLLWMLPIAPP